MCRFFLALAAACLAFSGRADIPPPPAAPPIIPVETLFMRPAISALTFSPNGKTIACLVTYEGHANLAAIDLVKMNKVLLTHFKDKNVSSILWANDDRIIFQADPGGRENPFIYAINRDGKQGVTLREGGEEMGVNGAVTALLGRVEGETRYVLVEAHVGQYGYPDVCRMDLVTGDLTPITRNPGRVRSWILDRTKHPRIGMTAEGPHHQILYRDANSSADWKVIEEFNEPAPHWVPLGFDGDDRTLFVAAPTSRSTRAIYRYDTATQTLGDVVHADDTYDLAEVVYAKPTLVYNEAKKKVVGLRYDAERPTFHWLDEDFAQEQRKLDASLPGYINEQTHTSADGKTSLIFSFNDRDPGVYYLFNRERKKVDELAVLKPAIKPQLMAKVEPVAFPARDGLLLHGYLTLPVGRKPERLPLVIHPHGGPYGIRDTWGYDPEVQFYANRGFAVLQINYRGSGGYGAKFERAGYKKWGLEMQNDLSDGVQWAIAKGVADPSRVVISGASYGGYAAMAGITFTPELYCAGINYVGVTDITLLLPKEGTADRTYWSRTHIGDVHEAADRQRLHDTSPVHFASRIQVPLLMGYGKNDPRVNIEHCYAMERALKSAGKPYELVIQEDEGHGFRNDEARVAFYKKIDEFLKNNVLAPGAVKIGPTKVLPGK